MYTDGDSATVTAALADAIRQAGPITSETTAILVDLDNGGSFLPVESISQVNNLVDHDNNNNGDQNDNQIQVRNILFPTESGLGSLPDISPQILIILLIKIIIK